MKLIPIGATCLLAATSTFFGLAAFAADSTTPERYRYGMDLDVQQLVALYEERSTICQVVDARMEYLDSNGQLRSLAYRKHASACDNKH